MGDIGVRATDEIIEDLKAKVKENKIKDPKDCKQLLIDTDVYKRQNLNKGECGCDRDILDPRMSVFKDILKNFKEV